MLQYTDFLQKITEAYASLSSIIADKKKSEKDCIDGIWYNLIAKAKVTRKTNPDVQYDGETKF